MVSNSIETSPISSRVSSVEDVVASSDNTSCSPTLSERSLSLESLVSIISDDEDSDGSSLPSDTIHSRKRKFDACCFEDCEEIIMKKPKDATEKERLILYAQTVSNWHDEITKDMSRTGRRYSVPALGIPEFLEKHVNINCKVPLKKRKVCPVDQWPAKIKLNLSYEMAFIHMRANDERRIALNRQQAAARNIKLVLEEDECSTFDDVQYLIYERAMTVWRQLQLRGRQLKDVAMPHFSWTDADVKKLELAVFPVQQYSQLVCETPPLPFVNDFKEYHTDWY